MAENKVILMRIAAMQRKKNYHTQLSSSFIIAAFLLFSMLLGGLAIADITPFERKEIPWTTYGQYVARYPLLDCSEYNYNNGELPQDLTITDMPANAILSGYSFAEIRYNDESKENVLIQIEKGIQITQRSYSTDTRTFDLPKSGTGSGNCTGAFFLDFSPPAITTTTLLVNESGNITATTSTTLDNTTSTSPTYSINAVTTTTTLPPSNNIVTTITNGIRQFFANVFGWLSNIFR